MFSAYKPLNQGGIPLVGGAFGAPQFADPTLTNQFSVFGPLDPTYPAYDSYGKLLKALGVTKLATLGYGTVPSSKNSATAFATSAKAAGIGICYENYSLPAGGVDFTPIALAIKAAGCDGVYASRVASSQLALAQSVRDSGVTLKGIVSTQGYEQTTLDDARVREAAQGITFVSPMSQVSDPNPGMQELLDDLKKYANSTGIPSFGEFGGWLAADAVITGIKASGQDVNRESFIKALRAVTDYTAGGVLAGPTDFSVEKIGHGDSVLSGSQCWFAQKLVGDSFRSVSGTTPFCGRPVAAGAAAN
jgi:branched-chain amino acid transport system substrate-binding protein